MPYEEKISRKISKKKISRKKTYLKSTEKATVTNTGSSQADQLPSGDSHINSSPLAVRIPTHHSVSPTPRSYPIGDYEPELPKMRIGLTALAFVYGGGVMLAVNHSLPCKDHKSDRKSVQNLIVLSSHIIGTISGEEDDIAECKSLLKDLKRKCRRSGGENISVLEAARLMVEVLSSRNEVGLIAGWNSETGAGEVYQVDSEQVLQADDFYKMQATGYGSIAAYTVAMALKEQNKYYHDMSLEKAVNAAKRGICNGLYMDGDREDYASGPKGWKLVSGGINIGKSWEEYGLTYPNQKHMDPSYRKKVARMKRMFRMNH